MPPQPHFSQEPYNLRQAKRPSRDDQLCRLEPNLTITNLEQLQSD